MNFLSKIALMATLSTVVCSGFAMDNVTDKVSETAKAGVEFAQENPGTAALLATAAAATTWFAVKWFGSSKAKAAAPVITATAEVKPAVVKPAAKAPVKRAGMFGNGK